MIKHITATFVLLVSSFITFAQSDTAFMRKEVRRLGAEIIVLKATNSGLNSKIDNLSNALRSKTDSLQNQVSANTSNIQATADKLGIKIDQSAKKATQKIEELDNSMSKNSLYWIIGFLITALLFVIIYSLLRKKITDGNSVLDQQILTTKKALEEEGIKLDTKLTEVLETQLKLLNVERKTTTTTSTAEETDHSLALKVADEIVRIQKNLANMDSNTKGLKQLAASVKRIQDNFEANGYEIAELLSKPYDPKMKVIVASSIPDENLGSGEEIITRIIKPQVNFKGVMIQSAQVEVSVGQ